MSREPISVTHCKHQHTDPELWTSMRVVCVCVHAKRQRGGQHWCLLMGLCSTSPCLCPPPLHSPFPLSLSSRPFLHSFLILTIKCTGLLNHSFQSRPYVYSSLVQPLTLPPDVLPIISQKHRGLWPAAAVRQRSPCRCFVLSLESFSLYSQHLHNPSS